MPDGPRPTNSPALLPLWAPLKVPPVTRRLPVALSPTKILEGLSALLDPMFSFISADPLTMALLPSVGMPSLQLDADFQGPWPVKTLP